MHCMHCMYCMHVCFWLIRPALNAKPNQRRAPFESQWKIPQDRAEHCLCVFHLGGNSLPPWSSLDGIPRIEGGLCIDYGDIITAGPSLLNQEVKDKLTIDNEIISPRGSPVERISGPLEHEDTAELADPDEHSEENMENHCENEHNNNRDDNVFGFENHYHFLTPDIYEAEPRNPSQVSGSSSDSGYHGNNHNRQRKMGVWRASNCECML